MSPVEAKIFIEADICGTRRVNIPPGQGFELEAKIRGAGDVSRRSRHYFFEAQGSRVPVSTARSLGSSKNGTVPIAGGPIAALTRWARWMGAGSACGHPA